MSKAKKDTQDAVVMHASDLVKKILKGKLGLEKQEEDGTEPLEGRYYKIAKARIVDGYCHYGFDIVTGTAEGDAVPTQKGSHVITDDLRKAFNKLNVHLAYMDDIFKHAGVEIKDIDLMHTDDLATLYVVSGFQITGSEENESVILMGDKELNNGRGARLSLTMPKIGIDELSSYKWYNELKDAVDVAREEVALYREGKYIADDDEKEEKEMKKQTKISFKASVHERKDDDNSEIENVAAIIEAEHTQDNAAFEHSMQDFENSEI